MSGLLRPSSFPFHLLCSLVFFLLCGCRENVEEDLSSYNETSRECLGCHELDFDADHRFDCLACHLKSQKDAVSLEDHPPVLSRPAHPDYAMQVCADCHAEEIKMVSGNNHYTLSAHVTLTRYAFGVSADEPAPETPAGINSYDEPAAVSELVDDLLGRRCLRCHVYTSGDSFSSVTRGTGCAACHLSFEGGRMISHQFAANPADDRCLSCHYGNHVGYDYHGRFEHDFNEEYRTPYFAEKKNPRPHGVEARQLQRDIHQRAGMVCIDCHARSNVMGAAGNPQCIDCHRSAGGAEAPGAFENGDGVPVFTSAVSAEEFAVPLLKHQAHWAYGERFSCQACHARWTYNDAPTHLLRIDHEDFYDFYKLSLDGSSEVLNIISSHISDDGAFLEPVMSNKFSGIEKPGIWFKGYGERRWESVRLIEDDAGRITTGRPILDLRLSWIDEYEEVRFDNIEPLEGRARIRPYAAHTIGSAGLFYEDRIRPFLESKGNEPYSTKSENVSADR